MNKAQKKAIEQVIGGYEDDLYRFKMQRQSMPNWVSGNGIPISRIIERLEDSIAELKEGLN